MLNGNFAPGSRRSEFRPFSPAPGGMRLHPETPLPAHSVPLSGVPDKNMPHTRRDPRHHTRRLYRPVGSSSFNRISATRCPSSSRFFDLPVECIETLPETIRWLHKQEIEQLTMPPTLYNQTGTMERHKHATERLREIIREYLLHSQELDFVPSVKDFVLQFWHNRFRCIPRNSDLFITASGNYLYCYNDISHKLTFGHIDQLSIRKALDKREKMKAIPEICKNCNMRNRNKLGEVTSVAAHYLYVKARKLSMI
jgi:hypothetical protein